MKPPTILYVIDDDPRVLKALELLLRDAGYMVQGFQTAARFLRNFDASRPGCVICDLAMPRIDGLALHRKLLARGSRGPVIFLSGHDSVPGSVQAMKQGAVDFLTKPVKEDLLLRTVRAAIRRDEERREREGRVAALSAREREVLRHVIVGRLNKEIAELCGISIRTVKFHRINLARKLQVKSTAELVTIGLQGGLLPADEQKSVEDLA